jgi:hypothetical protein
LKGEGPDVAKTLLGIPAEKRVRCVISVGFPDLAAIEARPKRPDPRKPMTEFAHFEKY